MMKKRLSKSFSSLYKARNRFIASQSTVNNNKFGVVKLGHGSLKFGLSKEEDAWLNKLQITKRAVPIQGFTDPNTKRKTIYIVDGYDPNTNTVLEFCGDYWHGNPLKYNQLMYDKRLKKTYGQLYKETIQRFYVLHCLGYKVMFVWESQWKKGHMGRYYRGPGDNLL